MAELYPGFRLQPTPLTSPAVPTARVVPVAVMAPVIGVTALGWCAAIMARSGARGAMGYPQQPWHALSHGCGRSPALQSGSAAGVGTLTGLSVAESTLHWLTTCPSGTFPGCSSWRPLLGYELPVSAGHRIDGSRCIPCTRACRAQPGRSALSHNHLSRAAKPLVGL